ncbi:hypothetical protein [Bacillus sp. JJ722]|uniref:hypothetical protein n=1 Tax=Bacillus sp. JJ722 TaxID=3122973 RepID=UPI003000A0D4
MIVFLPHKRLIPFSPPLTRNRAYSDDEYKCILKHSNGATKIGIQLMKELGLRVKEAANVRVEHFNLDGGVLYIVDG